MGGGGFWESVANPVAAQAEAQANNLRVPVSNEKLGINTDLLNHLNSGDQKPYAALSGQLFTNPAGKIFNAQGQDVSEPYSMFQNVSKQTQAANQTYQDYLNKAKAQGAGRTDTLLTKAPAGKTLLV